MLYVPRSANTQIGQIRLVLCEFPLVGPPVLSVDASYINCTYTYTLLLSLSQESSMSGILSTSNGPPPVQQKKAASGFCVLISLQGGDLSIQTGGIRDDRWVFGCVNATVVQAPACCVAVFGREFRSLAIGFAALAFPL